PFATARPVRQAGRDTSGGRVRPPGVRGGEEAAMATTPTAGRLGQGTLGDGLPYLRAGTGDPLVYLPGITPHHHVPQGMERRAQMALLKPFLGGRQVWGRTGWVRGGSRSDGRSRCCGRGGSTRPPRRSWRRWAPGGSASGCSAGSAGYWLRRWSVTATRI